MLEQRFAVVLVRALPVALLISGVFLAKRCSSIARETQCSGLLCTVLAGIPSL
jgi:hypothetical protein